MEVDSTDDEDRALAARQAALQVEAEMVASDLDLDRLLSAFGRPVRVGSAVLGLMVWRDLDVTVACSTLDRESIVQLGARLAGHGRIRQVVFRDDTGEWNTDPAYPDGLYLGLSHRTTSGDDWKVDIWFVDEPDRQPDIAHLQSMPPRLNVECRAAILRIKTECGRTVRSFDVYTAVLDDGVRTVGDFERWLARRSAQL